MTDKYIKKIGFSWMGKLTSYENNIWKINKLNSVLINIFSSNAGL